MTFAIFMLAFLVYIVGWASLLFNNSLEDIARELSSRVSKELYDDVKALGIALLFVIGVPILVSGIIVWVTGPNTSALPTTRQWKLMLLIFSSAGVVHILTGMIGVLVICRKSGKLEIYSKVTRYRYVKNVNTAYELPGKYSILSSERSGRDFDFIFASLALLISVGCFAIIGLSWFMLIPLAILVFFLIRALY